MPSLTPVCQSPATNRQYQVRCAGHGIRPQTPPTETISHVIPANLKRAPRTTTRPLHMLGTPAPIPRRSIWLRLENPPSQMFLAGGNNKLEPDRSA
jgi:hypothetical protein